jgi:hypothetical protein
MQLSDAKRSFKPLGNMSYHPEIILLVGDKMAERV